MRGVLLSAEAKSLIWHYANLLILLDITAVALAGLVRFGPFTGVAVTGVCLEYGLGAVTCYSAYPLTIFVFAAFMVVLDLKRPQIAIPMMMFTVSFGELAFFLCSVDPLLLVLPHTGPFFIAAYFQPAISLVWIACVVVGLLLLQRQGISPKRLRFFLVWFAYDMAGYFFEPYFHTTWPSMIAAEVNVSLFCAAMWFVFGLDKFNAGSDRNRCATAASVPSGTQKTA